MWSAGGDAGALGCPAVQCQFLEGESRMADVTKESPDSGGGGRGRVRRRRRSRSTGARRSTTRRPRRSRSRRTRAIRRSSSASARRTSPRASSSTRRCSTWDRKWDTVLDTSNPPFFKWFVGGRLNACVNCVDRHLESRGDHNALIWVPEPEDVEPVEITYARASPAGQRVRRAGAGLRGPGEGRPDHLPSADGAGAAGLDAGRGAARRDPLRGVRWLQRRGLRSAHGRRQEHRAGDDGRLLPQRRSDRPQGQGR